MSKKKADRFRQDIRLSGMMMRPVFMKTEQFVEASYSTEVSVRSDFMSAYRKFDEAKYIVAMCAKSFLFENWEKVKDWSGLEVDILDKSQKITSYYNYDADYAGKTRDIPAGGETKPSARFFAEMVADDKKRHNPVTAFTDLVLDSDGDFSVTINGKEHWWLDNDSVIIIADYAEEQIKKQEDVAV